MTKKKYDVPILPFPRRSDALKYLTAEQLRKRWVYGHVESVYRIQASELPYCRRGRRRLYRLEDVERYEAEHTEVFP